MHDVAICNNISLTFYTQFTSLLTSRFRTVLYEVFIFDNFRTDKSFLKITVNNTCSLWRCESKCDGPCSYFLHSGSEIGSQIKQAVSSADQLANTRLLQTEVIQEFLSFFVAFQLSDFRFDLCRNN